MAMVRLDKVEKSYGDTHVLRGIDLAVGEHEVVCLIGSSGCGKSTLLRTINLLDPIDAGTITFAGQEITARGVDANAIRRRMGIVFQSFNLFPHLRVIDNVTLGLRRALGMKKADADERAMTLLNQLGLGDQVDSYPNKLSGGQQQRVAICRALAAEPELLLLDEVTSALDPELVGEVLSVVRRLAGEGMTMILATHEMAFAKEVADNVAFLHGGVVHEQGPPEEIFGDPQTERAQDFLRRLREARRI
jgi:polar amino acid transport system ATP-binding protein